MSTINNVIIGFKRILIQIKHNKKINTYIKVLKIFKCKPTNSVNMIIKINSMQSVTIKNYNYDMYLIIIIYGTVLLYIMIVPSVG